VSASIEETIQLRNERKISEQEFSNNLEEFKDKIEETIHDSTMMLETKNIVKKRVSMIYSSVNKKTKATDKKNKRPASEKKEKKRNPAKK
jgi:hypothetical protein